MAASSEVETTRVVVSTPPAFGSRERWPFYLPAAFLLALLLAYPIVRTSVLSLFHLGLQTSFQSRFAGLDNFRRLFWDSQFRNSLLVTSTFTVVSVSIEFAIGLSLALAVDTIVHGRGVVRSIYLMPWTLPTAVIAVLWTWIFNDQYGVLNALLQKVHLIHSPVAWLATPATAMTAIIIADVWKTTPFVFVVLLAGLQNVPKDLYEALEMDGGGSWAKFRYVTWPFLQPFIFLSLVFRIIQAFAVFDLVYVMTGGGPGGSTQTVSLYSYQTYMRYLDMGYGSAQVVATVGILAMVAFLLHRVLLKRYANSF